MYVRGEAARVSFFHADAAGQPVSGQVLTTLIRRDQGTWTTSSSTPNEPSPGIAPGFYDLQLTEAETTCDHIDWYARTDDGEFVAAGQIDFAENPRTTADMVFEAMRTAPTDTADIALESAFMNRLADHILRRGMAEVERSSSGDAVGAASLVGVMSILTQGQLAVTQCNGETYLFLNSSIQGNAPIGALRVVNNSDGDRIGFLPLVGPNAVPDETLNCDCP